MYLAPSSQSLRDPKRMAEAVTVMDIDDEDNHSLKSNKGKSVAVGVPPEGKATPWVEKYRPQSLADVAAHRDIVDTSNYPNSLLLGFHFNFSAVFRLVSEKRQEKEPKLCNLMIEVTIVCYSIRASFSLLSEFPMLIGIQIEALPCLFCFWFFLFAV